MNANEQKPDASAGETITRFLVVPITAGASPAQQLRDVLMSLRTLAVTFNAPKEFRECANLLYLATVAGGLKVLHRISAPACSLIAAEYMARNGRPIPSELSEVMQFLDLEPGEVSGIAQRSALDDVLAAAGVVRPDGAENE